MLSGVDPVMITGATGLIGSNVCEQLREAGTRVRALVRHGSETEPLAALGVELVFGDITSPADVRRAAEGADAIVNSAALLGGAVQDFQASYEANYGGSVNCYDVAAGRRVIELATTTFLRHAAPLTEQPEVVDDVPGDPYSVSKAAAFREGRTRNAAGADIVFVIPGGTFGPSPTPKRAMSDTSFNRLIRAVLRGRISDYVSYPVPWVFVADVASVVVSSLEKGKTGDAYLAFGGEDAQTTAAFLNVACEVAGVEHRVAEVRIDPDDQAAVERYGTTLVGLAQRSWPVPWFDNSYTRAQLDYGPTDLRTGLSQTVTWLRTLGQVS
jgi:nucleoside-diphosphate-sugar epimerase